MRDLIVEEVRKAREEYARRFNYDLHAICEDLRRSQTASGALVVSFPKRPPRVDLTPKDGVRRSGTTSR